MRNAWYSLFVHAHILFSTVYLTHLYITSQEFRMGGEWIMNEDTISSDHLYIVNSGGEGEWTMNEVTISSDGTGVL